MRTGGKSEEMKSKNAFTLVELLVVIAIVITLAGIIWAVLGPGREYARQMICISHLHQIGLAASLYRQDYDGIDPSKGVPFGDAQLGLPATTSEFGEFLKSYIKDKRLLFCPDAPTDPTAGSNYGWPGFFDEMDPDIPPYAQLRNVVAQRGNNFVIVSDVNHNVNWNMGNEPSWDLKRVIFLRLNGQVVSKLVPVSDRLSNDW